MENRATVLIADGSEEFSEQLKEQSAVSMRWSVWPMTDSVPSS